MDGYDALMSLLDKFPTGAPPTDPPMTPAPKNPILGFASMTTSRSGRTAAGTLPGRYCPLDPGRILPAGKRGNRRQEEEFTDLTDRTDEEDKKKRKISF